MQGERLLNQRLRDFANSGSEADSLEVVFAWWIIVGPCLIRARAVSYIDQEALLPWGIAFLLHWHVTQAKLGSLVLA